MLPSLRLERKSCALNDTKRQLGVSEEGAICPSPFVGEALHPPPFLAFTSSFLLDLCSDSMGKLVSILASALPSQRTTGRRVSPSQPNCPGPSCSGVGPLDHYQGLIDRAYLVGSGTPDPRTQSRTRISLPRIPHRMPQDRYVRDLKTENIDGQSPRRLKTREPPHLETLIGVCESQAGVLGTQSQTRDFPRATDGFQRAERYQLFRLPPSLPL